MNIQLMEILACPACKLALKLTATVESGDDVIEGMLLCTDCGNQYPIVDSVPNLLLPQSYGL